MTMLDTAPDLHEVVVGVRSWNVMEEAISGQMLLTGNHLPWQKGVNQAVCAVEATHKAPVKHCGCGLYAYHDINRFDSNGIYGPVFGAVAGWGRMIVTKDGFRTEFAEIVAISPGPGGDLDTVDRSYSSLRSTFVKEHVKQLRAVADYYGVEVVEFDKLEDYALAYGRPVPEELLPGGPKTKQLPSVGVVYATQGAHVQQTVQPPTVHTPIVHIADQKYEEVVSREGPSSIIGFFMLVFGALAACILVLQMLYSGVFEWEFVPAIGIALWGRWLM